jgi:hypothetical protein
VEFQLSVTEARTAHPRTPPHIGYARSLLGGLAAALAIGAIAGLLPAIRAARMSPTQALWTM